MDAPPPAPSVKVSLCTFVLAMSSMLLHAAMGLRLISQVRSGIYIYVLYGEEPALWHERLVLHRVGRSAFFMIETPDGDIYAEEVGAPPLIAVRVGDDQRRLPDDLGAVNGQPVYRFAQTVRKPALARKVASAKVEAKALIDGDPETYPAVEQDVICSLDEVWIAVSPNREWALGADVGDELVERHARVLDGTALVLNQHGQTVTVEKMKAAEVPARIDELRNCWVVMTPRVPPGRGPPVGSPPESPRGADPGDAASAGGGKGGISLNDARILPVLTDSVGHRYRSTRSSAETSSRVEFSDWQVKGPRTCTWIIKELGKLGLDPVARHHQWRHENQQKEDQRTCVVHEMLSEIYELAVTYDQLDTVNCASMEMLLRYMQNTEAEVKKAQESKKDFDSSVYYLGRSRRTGGALVSPELTKWGADRASADYAILKEQRKIMDERKLAKK